MAQPVVPREVDVPAAAAEERRALVAEVALGVEVDLDTLLRSKMYGRRKAELIITINLGHHHHEFMTSV